MTKISKHFDFWSILVIVITFGLFTAALFTKGFTHDLLLEAGVLLVSIKLIMMGYRNSAASEKILEHLERNEKKIETVCGDK